MSPIKYYYNCFDTIFVMKNKLKKEILKSFKHDKITSAVPPALIIAHQLKKSKKYNELDDKEFNKVLIQNIHRRNQIRSKKYEETSIDDIDTKKSLNELLEYHLGHNDKNKTNSLIVILSYIEIEDENKKLTLTDQQYHTWLETSNTNQYITTKQFEILYGLSSRQQKGLRSKISDHLPFFKLSENANVLYNRLEVENWFENYSGKII